MHTLTRRTLLGLIGASLAASGLPRASAREGSPYLPLIAGLRRRYAVGQQLALDGKERGPSRLDELPGARCEETVLGVEAWKDGLCAEVEERWLEPLVVSTHRARWIPGGVLADAGPMSSPLGPVQTLSAEGWFLPDDPLGLKRWRSETRYESPVTRMHIRTEAVALGVETVDVPGGRFDALRVQVRTRSVVEHTGALSELAPITAEIEEEQLFAAGVGLVLVTSRTGGGYAAKKVLVGLE